jgi:hypothetical protein
MDERPTLDDVFRKFGETAEAAQLLETELGTLLLNEQATKEGLLGGDGIRATEIMRSINRDTLGGLVRRAKVRQSVEEIEVLLESALNARNRLIHSFYRQHNMCKFSEEGRMIMMHDLETIHMTIFDAYKALMLLGGTDLDERAKREFTPPTGHLPIG